MNKYCVYKITFPNLKAYIGITNNFEKRKQQHRRETLKKTKTKVYMALNKYGFDNCYFEILINNLTIEQARDEEIRLIKENNSIKKGYNSTHGGNISPILNPEIKNKIMKKIKRDDHRQKKSETMKSVFLNNPEMRKKVSESSKKMWKEKRDSLIFAMKKVNQSEEHILKMKEARKKAWDNEERRQKMSELAKKRNSSSEAKIIAKNNLNSKESIEKRNATKRTPEWRKAQSQKLKEYNERKKESLKEFENDKI